MASPRRENHNISCRNGLEVRVWGLRRSGNHALISWIMDHAGHPQVHLNDVHLKYRDPYLCFASARVRGLRRYTCRIKRYRINRYRFIPSVYRDFQFSLFTPRVDIEAIRESNKATLLISYEDLLLNEPRLHRFLQDADALVGSSTRRINLLLLRDPYNLFASLFKSGRVTHESRSFYRLLWKQHARQVTGEEVLIDDAHTVLYNRWCTEASYRIDLASVLGLTTDGTAYDNVPETGGGSSFDGVSSRGTELETLNRWRAFADDPAYRALFDDEIKELAESIFGIAPPF